MCRERGLPSDTSHLPSPDAKKDYLLDALALYELLRDPLGPSSQPCIAASDAYDGEPLGPGEEGEECMGSCYGGWDELFKSIDQSRQEHAPTESTFTLVEADEVITLSGTAVIGGDELLDGPCEDYKPLGVRLTLTAPAPLVPPPAAVVQGSVMESDLRQADLRELMRSDLDSSHSLRTSDLADAPWNRAKRRAVERRLQGSRRREDSRDRRRSDSSSRERRSPRRRRRSRSRTRHGRGGWSR